MAYDGQLADRIREALGKQRFTEKKMFGGLAFLIGGNMSVAASGQGGLLVRVDPDQTEQLLAEPGVDVMEMRGRPMKGWLRVDASVLDDEQALQVWVRRGVEYARTLPTK